jgi:hypothetical protein
MALPGLPFVLLVLSRSILFSPGGAFICIVNGN